MAAPGASCEPSKIMLRTTWPADLSRLRGPFLVPTPETGSTSGRVASRCICQETIWPPWCGVLVAAHTHRLSGGAPRARLQPHTRPCSRAQRGAGRPARHRYLLILFHTLQGKLGHRASWSNRKDMGVGHEQERRKWKFKKNLSSGK